MLSGPARTAWPAANGAPHGDQASGQRPPNGRAMVMPTEMPGCGKKLAVMAAVTLFWCGATSVFLIFTLATIHKQRTAQERFLVTKGIVVASKVKRHEADSSSGATYEPFVRYRYTVAGRDYSSTRYAYGMGSTSDRGHASRIVADHPPGREVRVWYDPDDPSEALLKPEVQGIHYFLLLFIQPFLLVGLGLLAYTVSIPFRHAKARTFLDQPEGLLGPIPGWGQASQDGRTITVRPGRNPFGPPLAFAAGYGGSCFAAIFVVAFLLKGFSNPDPRAVRTAFYVAAAIGAVAVLVALTRPDKKATLTIDRALGRLELTGPLRDVRLALSDIESWAVRTIDDPDGKKINGKALTRPLLAVRTVDGRPVPIHVFGTGQEMPFVARKVAQALGRLTDRPSTEAAAQESVEPGEAPEDLLNAIGQAMRKVRTRNRYRDIM